MKRLLLLLLLLPSAVLSQGTTAVQPQVTVETPTEDVIVGQPAIVRIKVLVPTFMPSPPVFPSLEQENLLVRLPERASGPVSEPVNGETWSGVQRSYRIYPLLAGQISLGVTDMKVTFADPETNAPIQVSVPLSPIAINAVVPDGATNLNPLIIATGFELEQEVEGVTEMQAGDAITRRLTARITGTSPILIPKLIPEYQEPLLRPYPKDPRLTETEDRGILSGQRVEEVVYLAQDGGQAQLPPVSFQWFNLSTDAVENVEVPGVDLTLTAPRSNPLTTDRMVEYALWLGLAAIVIWASLRWGAPRFRTWKDARHQAYSASPAFALAELQRALKAHDLSEAYSALETWKTRSSDPQGYRELEAQLARIGCARYASDTNQKTPDWSAAISAMKELAETPQSQAQPLPPLNP
ncbi:BatD family protein [Ruegeria arenilitoris]|uniref:BatD family protein n=1 Tax=Ruegeria arenilitoris TaxID=1173585 RepID=UPI00147C34C5|nr:BatD family protein [Ruegeria arenilitoris]